MADVDVAPHELLSNSQSKLHPVKRLSTDVYVKKSYILNVSPGPVLEYGIVLNGVDIVIGSNGIVQSDAADDMSMDRMDKCFIILKLKIIFI